MPNSSLPGLIKNIFSSVMSDDIKNINMDIDPEFLKLFGTGQLNPDFVEWMFLIPRGWTDLNKENDELEYWTEESEIPWFTTDVKRGRRKRIELLGNTVSPGIAREVFKAIIQVEDNVEESCDLK